MKKVILILSIIVLLCQSAFAQTGGVNFQGVARNSSGTVLANQKINLKFSILKTSETGTVEYTETKEVTTNAQGVFSVVVGEVNVTSFAAIDWKLSPKFLKVEMDPAGGSSFVVMGTTRLQNVPYAYYANGVNASNIDGTVSIAKGGTGGTDAATARTNLGLVIGTNVQAPLTAGTDYLTPTGNAASASKLATAKKINGIEFDGSTDITIPTTADASTLSGTVSVSKGGTGATTAAAARTNLGLVIGTNVQAPLTAGIDYLIPSGSAASLTNFPTLNQNTTGNAATANIAGNITATSNSSLVTLPSLSSVGTLISGTISLTTDIKTSGKIIVGTFSSTASSAVLEVNSTTKGFLPPRMTSVQRNRIVSPELGLVIFCTDCGKYGELEVFDRSNKWRNLLGQISTSNISLHYYQSNIYSFDGITWALTGINIPGGFETRNYLGEINGRAYFRIFYNNEYNIWEFDGSKFTKTSLIAPNGISYYTYIGVINNLIYYNVWNGIDRYLVYTFDGTAFTPIDVIDEPTPIGLSNYVGTINNKLYFNVNDGNNNYIFYYFDGYRFVNLSPPAGYYDRTNRPSALNKYNILGSINGNMYYKMPNGDIYKFDGNVFSFIQNTSLSVGISSYIGIINDKIYLNSSDGYSIYSFDGSNFSSIQNPNTPQSIGGWLDYVSGGSLIWNQ